jgi:hypothetical protein
LIWAISFKGANDVRVNSLAVDGSGNIYATGYFFGTVDIDPGAGVTNFTSAGNEDIFIVKLTSTGVLMWAKQIGGTSSDMATAIHVDGFGNLYTTGTYRGTVDFDPGAGTASLVASITDVFILKLDASANYTWAKKVGGTGPGNFVNAYTINVDGSSNVIIGGSFQGTVDVNPDPATTVNVTSGTGEAGLIIKVNSSGVYLWGKYIEGTGQESIQSLKTDVAGNVYSTGYFYGTSDFDPNAGTTSLVADFYDSFVWKLNPSGSLVWAVKLGGIFPDFGRALTLDFSGNVYTTGSLGGDADLDPGTGTHSPAALGSDDIYISKLDASGNFLMGIRFGGTNYEDGNAIGLNSAGNIIVAGNFQASADFDPGIGTYNLTPAGDYDIFLAKYSQTIILPVSLVDFSASLTSDQKVKLNWQTASEQNASEFIIERSADGRNYASIGSVAATGNTVITNEYTFTDADPKPVNIYRIRMMDADGKSQYSKTLMIKLGESMQSIKVFPNPVKDVLQLQTKMKGNLSIRIYDVAGQMVKLMEAVNSGISFSTTLDVDALPKGVYHLELSNGLVVERVRFIK